MGVIGSKIPQTNGTVPVVVCDEIKIVEVLKKFFEVEGEIPVSKIKDFLGLIFVRLGFNEQDNIELNNFNPDDCSFECDFNGSKCRIKVNMDSREIVKEFNECECGYVCEDCEYSEIGSRIILGRLTTKLSDTLIYTRCYSRKGMKFRYDFGDFILDLEMEMPEELPIIKKGKYTRYILTAKDRYDDDRYENEFNSLFTEYGIFGELFVLYEDMKTYLGDISRYSKFLFRKSIKTDKGLKLTDMISLKNGKMSCVVRTIGDKTVRIFSNGGWQYKLCKGDSKGMIVNSGFDNNDKTPKEVLGLRELVRKLKINNISL